MISANQSRFNHKEAFILNGYIDWKQSVKYNIGDIVFIYDTIPHQRIKYKAVVEKIDIAFDEITDDKEFWKDTKLYESSKVGVYSRLRLQDYVDSPSLDLKHLKENGLLAPPQHPIKLKNRNLFEYINSKFSNNDDSEVENEILHEGSLKTIKVNKYERNPIARKECIKKYGTDCFVCKMNFKEIYGDVGENFIHVHHIIPLNSIREDYQVNPEKDLIPVCPNCHAMLHRKYENRYLSIEELQQIIKNKK